MGVAAAASPLDYAEIQKVQAEMRWLKQLYAENPQWPVLDVTLSCVEETAARILHLASQQQQGAAGSKGEVSPSWVVEYGQ